MKKQIGFILGALILIFLVLGTVNAGFLDFLGGGNSNSTVAADNNTFVVGFDAEFLLTVIRMTKVNM